MKVLTPKHDIARLVIQRLHGIVQTYRNGMNSCSLPVVEKNKKNKRNEKKKETKKLNEMK